MEERRADFEKWCSAMSDMPTDRYQPSAGFRHAGMYVDIKVEYAWDAYNAGWAMAERKDA